MFIYSVKYLPVTNCCGSRVKIAYLRDGKSVSINYDYTYNHAIDQAIAYLESASNGTANIAGYDCDEKTGIAYIVSETYISIK